MRPHLLFLCFFVNGLFSQCKIDYSNYLQVWRDDFSYYSNPASMSSNWFFDYSFSSYNIGNCAKSNFGGPEEDQYYDQSMISLLNDANCVDGKCVRISCQRLSTPVTLTCNNTSKTFHFVSGALSPKITIDPSTTCTSSSTWGGNPRGLLYGMLEFRAKLPAGSAGIWPALWGYNVDIEYDLIDARYPDNLARSYISGVYNRKPGSGTGSCGIPNFKADKENLSDNYNLYSMSWTPTSITYFFNGREIYTFDLNKTVPTSSTNQTPVPLDFRSTCPAYIIMNLAVTNGTTSDNAEMLIDYVRVLKPKAKDSFGKHLYTYPYKSASEYMNKDIYNLSPTHSYVSSSSSSIATTNNNNELFYIGSDKQLYRSTFSNNSWNTAQIPFNWNVSPSVSYLDNNLIYNKYWNLVVYKGTNNSLQYFGYYNGWYQWFLDPTWDSRFNCSSYPNSVAVGNNGDIIYRGGDNKVQRFVNNNGSWSHSWLITSPYGINDFVSGDLIVNNQTPPQVFYRAANGKIQNFWYTGSTYTHDLVDHTAANDQSNAVSIIPGSMTINQAGVLYYIGADSKIHNYSWDAVNGWVHQTIPYSYSQSTNSYIDPAYAKSSIAYEEWSGNVIYTGVDGKIQAFYKTGNTWNHKWIDDYKNTDAFSSFANTSLSNIGRISSTRVTNDGKIVYTNKDSHLSFFKFGSCENLNPECGSVQNLRKMSITESEKESNTPNESALLKVYPNPTNSVITIETGEQSLNTKDTYNCKIINVSGQIVYEYQLAEDKISIDVSFLPKGLYIVIMSNGDQRMTKRLIIEE